MTVHQIFELHHGSAPLLISLPHNGTDVPEYIKTRLTPAALRLPDTDWHVARLYDFARDLGASILVPRYSRYVIDLNRSPDGHALYPGQNETGLCPTIGFDRAPLYLDGEEPKPEEIQTRTEKFWRPYHHALHDELNRLKSLHHHAVLWEGHSIRSEVPMFFQGRLADFNLGTAGGASCAARLQDKLSEILHQQRDYSIAINGRFKGGYITRHYGRPEQHVDAVQLELAQLNYMDEDSFEYLPERAEKVRALLGRLLQACI